MKFGRKLQTELPALYRNYALNYKELKEQIFYQDEVTVVEAVSREVVSENLRFQELLERELLKVNRFARLEIESIDSLKSAPSETIAQKLVELEKFVRLNKTGFRKISKKFDKLRKTNLQFWFMSRVERADFATIDFHSRLANLVSPFPSTLHPPPLKSTPRCFLIPADEVFALMTLIATSRSALIARDPTPIHLTIYDSKISAEPQSDNQVLITFGNRETVLRELVDDKTFNTLNLGNILGSVSYHRTTLYLDSGSHLLFDEEFSVEPESSENLDFGVLRVFGASADLIEDVLGHSGVSEVPEVIGNLSALLKRPKKPRLVSPEVAEVPAKADETKGGENFRQALVRVEPKTFFANERLLLDWVHVALVFAGVAALRGGRDAAWLAAGAVAVVGLAVRNFLRRRRLLLEKATHGYFTFVEPLLLATGVGLIVVVKLKRFYTSF